MTIKEIREGDWVVNERGYVCKIKYIYDRSGLTQDVRIADGVNWFGLITVFLDKSRLATKEEIAKHKKSKDRPFNVNREVKPL